MNTITSSNNINFNAYYIGETIIKKRSFLSYKPVKASIVMFDKNNEKDSQALSKFAARCGRNSMFAGIIYSFVMPKHSVVGITTQKDNFRKINPELLLGAAEYYPEANNVLWIERLQTEPKSAHKKWNFLRKYKGIGHAIIEYIKSVKGRKRIELFAAHNALGFYKKNGFKSKSKKAEYIMTYE